MSGLYIGRIVLLGRLKMLVILRSFSEWMMVLVFVILGVEG